MQQPHQPVPQVTQPAEAEYQRDWDRSAGGHAYLDGQSRPLQSVPETHLAVVATLLQEIGGLRQRLVSQAVIEQAKGILMGHYRINSDTAFQLLRRWSQDSNTKVRDIAKLLTEAALDPAGHRPAPHQIVEQHRHVPAGGDPVQPSKDQKDQRE